MSSIANDSQLLTRLISAAGLRSKVTSANMANLNTPGYRRQVVKFEGELQDAMQRGSGHAARIEPSIEEDLVSPARSDGNNVTLELEMNTMRENRLLMETYMTILQSQFGLLETAITGQ